MRKNCFSSTIGSVPCNLLHMFFFVAWIGWSPIAIKSKRMTVWNVHRELQFLNLNCYLKKSRSPCYSIRRHHRINTAVHCQNVFHLYFNSFNDVFVPIDGCVWDSQHWFSNFWKKKMFFFCTLVLLNWWISVIFLSFKETTWKTSSINQTDAWFMCQDDHRSRR